MSYSKEFYEKNKESIKEANRKQYEKNKEAIRERQKAYYAAHKEEILAKQKAKAEAEKASGVVKPKKKYVSNKPLTPKQAAKKFLKPFKEKYKGFTFELNDNIVAIEVKLPFRIVKEEYGVKHCDDATYQKIQNELRRKVYPLCKHNHIIVIECQYLQAFLSKDENLDEICTIIREFVKEKLEIYGQYTKRGYLVGADFE